jgi:hypothetical protein
MLALFTFQLAVLSLPAAGSAQSSWRTQLIYWNWRPQLVFSFHVSVAQGALSNCVPCTFSHKTLSASGVILGIVSGRTRIGFHKTCTYCFRFRCIQLIENDLYPSFPLSFMTLRLRNFPSRMLSNFAVWEIRELCACSVLSQSNLFPLHLFATLLHDTHFLPPIS